MSTVEKPLLDEYSIRIVCDGMAKIPYRATIRRSGQSEYEAGEVCAVSEPELIQKAKAWAARLLAEASS